jgi:beta-1,4-mannosyltransferase
LTLGRGVVATDIPYFREILGQDSPAGILVPPCDPEGLARGIRRFLQIPFQERCAAARAIADKYPWPEVVKAVVEEIWPIYRERNSGC